MLRRRWWRRARAGAADRWRGYLGRWTVRNHLRAAAALAATGLLIVALQLG
jgi:uncharacterized membrane protein